ncbi:MAG: CCC motif membrane protein [Flavobacteriaceae bacterium]
MNPIELPKSKNALTMGILSIVLTLFCCGPFGAIFGILGLNDANAAIRTYEANPDAYSTGLENAKTGKILSYIGIGLAVLYLIFIIIYFGVIAALVMGSGEF